MMVENSNQYVCLITALTLWVILPVFTITYIMYKNK